MAINTPAPPSEPRKATSPRSERRAVSLFRPDIVRRALIDSLIKLDPRVQIRNPVMFVVEIGAVITTVTWLIQVFGGKALGGNDPAWYTFVISFWLWLTVVFANMAEAFAEGRGRAQADTLRSMRQETVAHMQDGTTRHGTGPLHVLNIMSLGTPRSAVISAIIFNAIVIPLLIPISLRGVAYRPIGASALLRRNLWIYGLGGLIAPFIGIKLIDLIVHNLLGA
jgi:high-affinity K+ transport system ATPase subunit B